LSEWLTRSPKCGAFDYRRAGWHQVYSEMRRFVLRNNSMKAKPPLQPCARR
jgi:hypothetical protein